MGKFQKGRHASKETEFKSGAQAVENGRKGGIESQRKQHERATLLGALRVLLQEEHTNSKGDKRTGFEIAALGLFKKLQSGDVNAIKFVAEALGEYRQGLDITSKDLTINVGVSNPETESKLKEILKLQDADHEDI